MPKSCGYAAYKPGASLWLIGPHTHNLTSKAGKSYGKTPAFTHLNPQLHTFLYTIYTQYYSTFVSVTSRLVHRIHIAYKEHNELNKGTL